MSIKKDWEEVGKHCWPSCENSSLIQDSCSGHSPAAFFLLQNSSRISCTLESLSPFCQLIDGKWVLKLVVLVSAQLGQ